MRANEKEIIKLYTLSQKTGSPVRHRRARKAKTGVAGPAKRPRIHGTNDTYRFWLVDFVVVCFSALVQGSVSFSSSSSFSPSFVIARG